MTNTIGGPQSVTAPRDSSYKPPMSAERKAFWHSPYTNADAETLLSRAQSGFLKNESGEKVELASVDAAKAYIGKAIIEKKEAPRLAQAGVTRKLTDWGDREQKAFKLGGYTAQDVAKAKKTMTFLDGASDLQVRGYLGLKVLNGSLGLEVLKDYGITPGKPEAFVDEKPATSPVVTQPASDLFGQ